MVTARRLFDAGVEVELFEARDRVGGHTATVDVELSGRKIAVDTGFIVFNERTYPGFCALLEELGVEFYASDMSFSARVDGPGVEYCGGTNMSALFAQRRNLVRPRYWSMLRGIMRFYREAPVDMESGALDGVSLGAYLERGRYSRAFIDWHIVPMACAVWSGIPRDILDFPARTLVRFFANHGFLDVRGRPPWLTVRSGSRTYAAALLAPLQHSVRLSTPVERVKPLAGGRVEVSTETGTDSFDRVVLACHAPQALALLDSPTDAETDVLGAIRFQPNDVVLHTDPAPMPRQKRAWGAWNVWTPKEEAAADQPVRVTYWMNRLQSLDVAEDVFVTLNTTDAIDPERILERKTFEHPIFDAAAVAAQGRHSEIDGVRGIHYCGAYWSYGFHEDGVQSARRVLRSLGVDPKIPTRGEELRPDSKAGCVETPL